MNTQDFDYKEPGVFALFKGPSGAGKTVAALSFPDVWMADFDRKMPTIARKHFPKKSINYDQFDDMFKFVDQLVMWVGSCPHETLLFDSITSMVSLLLKSIGMAKGEGMERMIKNMQTQMGRFKQELLSIDYYNAETRIMEHIIDVSKVLFSQPGNPRNVIFTAHILASESAPDLKTKIVTKSRSIVTAGKKVAAYIPTQFDEVYLFGTGAEQALDASATMRVKHLATMETVGEDDAKTAFRVNQMIDFTEPNADFYTQLKSQIAGSEMFL